MLALIVLYLLTSLLAYHFIHSLVLTSMHLLFTLQLWMVKGTWHSINQTFTAVLVCSGYSHATSFSIHAHVNGIFYLRQCTSGYRR